MENAVGYIKKNFLAGLELNDFSPGQPGRPPMAGQRGRCPPAPTGLKRVDHDVLARPNVTHLIVMEGINDISYEHPKAEQLIEAYEHVIATAHGMGIKVSFLAPLPSVTTA